MAKVSSISKASNHFTSNREQKKATVSRKSLLTVDLYHSSLQYRSSSRPWLQPHLK